MIGYQTCTEKVCSVTYKHSCYMD